MNCPHCGCRINVNIAFSGNLRLDNTTAKCPGCKKNIKCITETKYVPKMIRRIPQNFIKGKIRKAI